MLHRLTNRAWAILLSAMGMALAAGLLWPHLAMRGRDVLAGACGGKAGPCAEALNSRWAVVPPAPSGVSAHRALVGPQRRVPVSLAAVWYFAFLLLWFALVDRPRPGWLHALPTLAVLAGWAGSAFFLWLMARRGSWCWPCVATHAANLLLGAVVLAAWRRRPPARPGYGFTGPLWVLAIWMALGAGLLWGTDLRLRQQAQRMAEEVWLLAERGPMMAEDHFEQAPRAIDLGADPILIGRRDAPMALVVFVDAMCEACREFDQMLQQKIEPMLGRRLRVVYKHFPLSRRCNPDMEDIHPHACESAALLQAAWMQGGPGAFRAAWHRIGPRQEPFTDAEVARLAGELGLDPARLLKDRDDPAVRQRIAADVALGRSLDISSTPSLFLDGRPVDGAARMVAEFWEAVAERW